MNPTIEPKTGLNVTAKDQGAGSLARAMILLRVLARSAPEGTRIADLISQSELPRATVYRVLGMLSEAGWIERRKDRKYYFGIEMFSLTHAAQSHQLLDRIALPHLAKLRDQLGQTVYLTKRVGVDAICVVRLEANDIVQMLVMDVGTRIPLGLGAGGLAMLAALPEDERNELIRINMPRFRERPSFNLDSFNATLSAALELGYASHKGLFIPGVAGIGVPVLDSHSRPLVAVSTAFLNEWIAPGDYKDCAALICRTAKAIGADLAGGGPVASPAVRQEVPNEP